MPTIQVQDRAPISKTRKLADGRVAAVARFARSGVHQYSGAELGRPDLRTVNVYRSEAEVFAEDAMASFAHKTMTLGHPSEAVDAGNWKRHAIGYTEGRVARDGGYVEIPLILADAGAVSAYESGSATELSAGYSCELVWGDGTAPDGTPYQARQERIRGNHLALVEKGRAGSQCRIGDSMMDPVHDGLATSDEARRRMEHHLSTGSMGDRAPSFEDWSESRRQAEAVRDAARDGRYDDADASAMTSSARQLMIDLLTDPGQGKAVRDAARDSRYAGGR